MSSILKPEMAAVFGALDSDAIGDGDAVSAHLVRSLVKAANRAASRAGEPLFNFIYDSGGNGTETPAGGFVGYGYTLWTRILPGPLFKKKKPGLTKAKLFVRFHARTDEQLFIQVVTRASPFNPIATGSSPNCIKLVGTNAWAWDDKEDIPIAYEGSEEISVFLRGVATTTLGNGSNGANSGTISSISPDGTDVADNVTPPNWVLPPAANFASGGHAYVALLNGNPIAPPSTIISVLAGDHLSIFPGLPAFYHTALQLNGAGAYRIYELPRWRIANIALYPQDRSVP